MSSVNFLKPSALLVGGPTVGKTTLLTSIKSDVVDTDDIIYELAPSWVDLKWYQRQDKIAAVLQDMLNRVVGYEIGKLDDLPVLTNLWGPAFLKNALGEGVKPGLGVFPANPERIAGLSRKRDRSGGIPLSLASKWISDWREYAPVVFKEVIWLDDDQYLSDVVKLNDNVWETTNMGLSELHVSTLPNGSFFFNESCPETFHAMCDYLSGDIRQKSIEVFNGGGYLSSAVFILMLLHKSKSLALIVEPCSAGVLLACGNTSSYSGFVHLHAFGSADSFGDALDVISWIWRVAAHSCDRHKLRTYCRVMKFYYCVAEVLGIDYDLLNDYWVTMYSGVFFTSEENEIQSNVFRQLSDGIESVETSSFQRAQEMFQERGGNVS